MGDTNHLLTGIILQVGWGSPLVHEGFEAETYGKIWKTLPEKWMVGILVQKISVREGNP